jgi:hypothetical protein
MALLGWILVSKAIQCAVAALASDLHVRAGERGIAFRVPRRATFLRLLLDHGVVERELAWDEIRSLKPLVFRMKRRIPVAAYVVVKTTAGEEIPIPSLPFIESMPELIERICAHREGGLDSFDRAVGRRR